MFRLSILSLALLAAPAAADDPRPKGDTADLAKVVAQIVERTNDFRKAEKREPVKTSHELFLTAEYFAKFMAETGKYGHEADGSKPGERAKKHGYEYCVVLENIAYIYHPNGFTTDALAAALVKGWQDSPPHRRSMLDPDVVETGVAVARSKETGYYYAVQMFGRPKSMTVEFKFTNRSDATLEYTIGEDKYTLEPRYTQTHTRCRPGEVTFQAPKGLEAVKARADDKFEVTGKAGSYQVKKE
jgi:uncharacterized protein YkwD